MAVDRNAIIKEAQKLAGKGQFDKAIAEWRKLLKDFPSDSSIFNTIGDLCLKKNDAKGKSEAVEAYGRAGTILAAEGFSSKAIALYKKVLNIDPSKVEVHLALGDLNAEKGLAGPALESYKIVADHFTKQKKMPQALGVYQKMADLNPANVAFRVKLAGMYAKEGMKTEAVHAYLAAADVHVSKDAFQEARQMFEKVLETDPENKEVYHKAGIVYAKEGKFDEARKALKRAFEAASDNEELMTLYLEVLDKAGRGGDAEDIYRKLLARDPARHDLHEKLYDILLAKKDFDKALIEATAIAVSKAESMDFTGAADVLKQFLSVTHDPLAAAGALGDLFKKHGRAKEGGLELVKAADLLIDRNSVDDAREVLNRALLVAPDLAEAKDKLSSLGGAAPAAAEEISLPPEEPLAEAPARPAPAAPQAPAVPPGGAEDPAVLSALAEVDVLIKYGLGTKAIEQLEGIVRNHPSSVRVRALLLDLYRKENRTDKAVIQALMLAELHENSGRSDESQSVLRDALELAPGNPQIMAKLGLSPAAGEAEAPEEIETIEEPESFEMIPEEGPAIIPDIPSFGEETEEIRLPESPEETGESAFEDLSVEEEPAPERIAPPRRTKAPLPPSVPEESYEEESVLEETGAKEPFAEQDVTELWAEAEFYYQQGLFDEARKQYETILEINPGDSRAMERVVEITREKEDVQEFSRLADAVEGLESIVSAGGKTDRETATPTDVDAVRSLMQEIADLRKGQTAEKAPAAAARPASPALSEEESFAGLLDEMAAEKTPAAPPKRPARPAADEEESFAGLMESVEQPATAPRMPAAEPEESFAGLGDDLGATGAAPARRTADDELSDFFDLAAELKDELSTSPAKAPAAGEEQSLDEIFEEFKAGVEAHEKKEDEDTHYNLGIAYREMGLLDDAISEFNMTSEGEPKFIQSRYLLGLCYLEKEDYETAITEIQKALGYSYSFGEASEERIGMHYDLGLAYQGVDNSTGAMEEFQKVHNLDPTYREVATKMKGLQEGEFISLDSIKEDIEKEISFKFLEEGARIEREEKTKKSKK
ncbi:MAG: tetratricopeptide repeat protein [Nitrospirota bacterium]|nr:tetratricopeptide repeat protein [Nitrospirota bacterium]